MPRLLVPVLAVSILVLLAVAAKPILLPAGNARLTKENFERIKGEMTPAEVEAILGPPGDYRTGPTRLGGRHIRWIFSAFTSWSGLEWKGDEGEIRVWVDRAGEVASGDFDSMQPTQVGLFDLLRWRWNRWRESRR